MARFLGLLSQAVHKHGIYPPGHPALGSVVGTLMDTLEPLLAGRQVFSLGVASRQLTAEGAESPPDHPRFSFLAGRLHRHQVASLTFERGIGAGEIAGFLAHVCREPELGEDPLGRAAPPGWPHLRVQPVRYDRLRLIRKRDRAAEDAAAENGSRSGRLWLGLARAALVADAAGSPEAGVDSGIRDGDEVAALARSVEAYASDRAYAEEVLDHIVSLSRELRSARGPEADRLRDCTGRLISLVHPDALREVLRSGGDSGERRELLLDTCEWMDPPSVVKLVRATAGVDRQDLSHWLLLLMSKLARHASEPDESGLEAEASLREQVAELVEDWTLEDPVPTGYAEALERMSSGRARRSGHGIVAVDPERLLQVSLEVDRNGPATFAAVGELDREGRVDDLVRILDRAPPCDATEELWDEVADPERLADLLAEPEIDFDTVDRLVDRLGAEAAEPLLDALCRSEERAVRRRLFCRVAALGADVTPHVLRRLEEDGRWYVKRNMLALMAEFERWPPKWSPASWAEDRHPAVRRQALKLMLRSDRLRDAAVCGLLEDRDPRSLALGLAAAQEGLPADVIVLVASLAEDDSLRPDLRRAAARALAESHDPHSLDLLLELARRPAPWPLGWFGRKRLREKSPVMLEALAGLARVWHRDPRAVRLLARAAKSQDPEIRAAVVPGGPEEAGR